MSNEQDYTRPLPSNLIELYKALLVYVSSVLELGEDETKPLVAFVMKDGSFKFSVCDPFDVLIKIIEESVFSDRLLVIVSVAYLEDQIRLLLENFLTDDEATHDLFDPNKNLLSSLVPMANLAFSLGLIAKDWFEILKRMANLRNKFAHIPSARSFNDLINDDPKTLGLLDSLASRYKQLTSDKEIGETYQEDYKSLFLLMYELIQFAIDHIATLKPIQPFDQDEIIGIHRILGFTRGNIQLLINSSLKEV